MTLPRPDVVAFDVNETLLDLSPVAAALVEHGQPGGLLPAVFARTLHTGTAATVAGVWVSFRAAFESALAQLTDLSGRDRSRVADSFLELSPHPDVEPALRRLAEAGVRVVTLSHGSPGVAEAGLERGGIAPLVERTLTSESVRAWKPSREAYLWAAGACGVEPSRMALVTCHPWDVHGAHGAGLRTGYVERTEPALPPFFASPDVTGEDLVEVVDRLLRG